MNNVYIGNLDLSATEDQVRTLLAPYGSITNADERDGDPTVPRCLAA